jgi:hypothetical protein
MNIYTYGTIVGLEWVVLNWLNSLIDERTERTDRLNCVRTEHHPRWTLYILADDVMLPEPSSSSFLDLPHCSMHWECSGSFFYRLGEVTENQSTLAVVKWSRVPVALYNILRYQFLKRLKQNWALSRVWYKNGIKYDTGGGDDPFVTLYLKSCDMLFHA